MKKYELLTGISITTHRGIAHAGAVIEASDLKLGRDAAEAHLDQLVKDGFAKKIDVDEEQAENPTPPAPGKKELKEKLSELKKALRDAATDDEKCQIEDEIAEVEAALKEL
ncbi:MAG: hypothetical protein KA369_08255 [Spirochaetes bacterium]|nr:hypothetical protein [Spirochaetota bacterium]